MALNMFARKEQTSEPERKGRRRRPKGSTPKITKTNSSSRLVAGLPPQPQKQEIPDCAAAPSAAPLVPAADAEAILAAAPAAATAEAVLRLSAEPVVRPAHATSPPPLAQAIASDLSVPSAGAVLRRGPSFFATPPPPMDHIVEMHRKKASAASLDTETGFWTERGLPGFAISVPSIKIKHPELAPKKREQNDTGIYAESLPALQQVLPNGAVPCPADATTPPGGASSSEGGAASSSDGGAASISDGGAASISAEGDIASNSAEGGAASNSADAGAASAEGGGANGSTEANRIARDAVYDGSAVGEQQRL